ncbi:MAG: hypothetical protein CMM58_07310 [Rhodospirillaceae bacterium]|nr:hypothetical protein [Rhodospirillaceae bacterium]|tara:strand:+ start:765 stop:1646 length:882 start_codon:yes stop_codon:yes gene_type:complete
MGKTIRFKHPEFLVESDWLKKHLEDTNIRIYDCTTHLLPHPTKAYTIGSGRDDYEKAHIPGADFLDLQGELSDNNSKFRFTLPSPQDFARAMGSHGLGNSNLAILYSTTSPQWATRIWWMLRAFGFDSARVLDGGLINWIQRGYPTSTRPSQYTPEVFTPTPKAGLIAGKEEVKMGIDDNNTCIVNALSHDQHTAKGGRVYGRPGRITNSVNVPTVELIDSSTNMFLPPDEIAKKFNSVGLNTADRVLTYCGGGIAASTTAMLLTMLGYDNVGLYDNSLSEWAADKNLPMEIG